MKESQLGDYVKFKQPNPDTNGTQECYGTIIKRSKFKATVETIKKYEGIPMKISMHVYAFTTINPEDMI